MGSQLIQLAKQILASAEEVDTYLRSHNLPQPSFNVDSPLDLDIRSPPAEKARLSAIEAAIELQDLLMGPTMILRPVVRLAPCLLYAQKSRFPINFSFVVSV